MDERTDRREFLRRISLFVGAWTGGSVLAGCLGGRRSEMRTPAPSGLPAQAPIALARPEPHLAASNGASVHSAGGKSRVVLFEHSGLTNEAWEVQRDVLEGVLDEAVMALTGETSAARAWGSLFSSDERVGIKPNGRGAGPRICTSPDLVLAVVDRLTGIGIKAENIIVWEQDGAFIANCRLPIQPDGPGFRCRGINGDFDDAVTSGQFRGRLTNIVTRRIDAIVNLPIVKDHGQAGVTLAMKNHYGSISNPSDHHDNNCDPYVADLNAVPAIRDKTRLIVCDGSRACYDGGPGGNPEFMWRPNALLASRDPVAHDAVGCQVIEAMRAQVGRPTLAQTGRAAKHIHSAAQLGLGTDDPARIELVRRTLG